ncbi:DUF1541 domain-containing protein [Paenibacillus faecis]|uniref:DUF1541 domain-containing protein n=1 Tax=Paenibacillus faecis TaxID=862114 RepID=A0A5D0CYH3_9BACL|nr:YdhK family protein [Paenibacillus faecis]TYA15089.1 DUF1541 domain-containing protein [Paenibacillus faecis]
MKKQLILLGIAALISLSGCRNNSSQSTTEGSAPTAGDASHSEMSHSGSGEIPSGLKESTNPKFRVGSQAVIHADHMPGMNGATATIVGAYETTVYSVSYIPTTGGDPINKHKWVIHQEIKDAGDKPFEPGAKVILNADHMPGMRGANATVDTAQAMNVYMVDYTPTTGGETVKNHQWVTEDELSAK